jgi:hypothetical protein
VGAPPVVYPNWSRIHSTGRFPIQRALTTTSAVAYETLVEEAMQKIISQARFGYASETTSEVLSEFWKKKQDSEEEDYYFLKLKPGKKPSQAIYALMSNLKSWAFDCAESIQVARWYAEMQMSGPDAFDKRYVGKSFKLKQHDSSGLRSGAFFQRVNAAGKYDIKENFKFDRKGVFKDCGKPEDTLLDDAPAGSRIMWRDFNPEIGEDNDFKNENTVKLGPDRYAAHPLGIGSKDFIHKGYAKYQVEAADPESTFWGVENEKRETPRREYKSSDPEVSKYAETWISIVEIEYAQ